MEFSNNDKKVKKDWKTVRHEVLQLAAYSCHAGIGIGFLCIGLFRPEHIVPSLSLFVVNFGIGGFGAIRTYSKVKNSFENSLKL